MHQPQRQQRDNLVYWPTRRSANNQLKPITKMMPNKNTSCSERLTDEPTRWSHHLQAVAQRQDKQAFHALYLHFSPKIKSFYLQKGMADKAEELTHEVFMKVWQKAASYNPEKAKVSTWIFTIVRNSRIDYLRKKRIEEVPEDETNEAHQENNYDQEIDLDRQKQKIAHVFQLLTEEQRNVLQKVYFEDKSHQVAALELQKTAGVVKSRIRSALKVLRTHMGAGEI